MNPPVQIDLRASKPAWVGAPVPVLLTVVNSTASPVAISLPYPNPNNLAFACLTPNFALAKQVQRQEIERTTPITIAPGQSFSQTHYLNRYLAFKQAGKAQMGYELTALVSQGSGARKVHERTRFAGRFDVTLTEATGTQLADELERYRRQLSLPDRQLRSEAAEALAYLETPASVPYIASMLSVENLEVTGIEALGRHPSQESVRLVSDMLGHRESAVVESALATLDRMGMPPSRTAVLRMLGSDNDHIRWLAVDWLSKRPDKQDLQFLAPALQDRSEPVRTSAQHYAEALRR